MSTAKLRQAHSRLDRAKRQAAKEVRELVPIGQRVSWTHGQHRQFGVVRDHDTLGLSRYMEVKVENERTGNVRWIGTNQAYGFRIER